MLKLAKNNTPAYDYYSDGDGSDPVAVAGTVTGAGGSINSSTVIAYLIATQFRYTDIGLSIINEQAGIDWKLSLNNSTWSGTISPADMNALAADVIIPIYIRGVVANDGSIATGIYTTPDIKIDYLENPS